VKATQTVECAGCDGGAPNGEVVFTIRRSYPLPRDMNICQMCSRQISCTKGNSSLYRAPQSSIIEAASLCIKKHHEMHTRRTLALCTLRLLFCRQQRLTIHTSCRRLFCRSMGQPRISGFFYTTLLLVTLIKPMKLWRLEELFTVSYR